MTTQTKKAFGMEVPALGLGTWKMRGHMCSEAVRHALSLGYRHVDTARAYDNEEAVGRGLRQAPVDREDVFLTTKLWRDELRPRVVATAAADSMRALDVDYLDLVLVHWPCDEVPLEHTLDAMLELVEQQRVRAIGLSNVTPSLLDRALAHTDALLTCQVEYHPFLSQQALLERCREHGMLLTAYSPLARGGVADHAVVRSIAERHEATPAQVALAWLLRQEAVIAIPKAATPAHREDNLAALELHLDDSDVCQLLPGPAPSIRIASSFATSAASPELSEGEGAGRAGFGAPLGAGGAATAACGVAPNAGASSSSPAVTTNDAPGPCRLGCWPRSCTVRSMRLT
jgi:2,5-diketo-D-gluconate reductase B